MGGIFHTGCRRFWVGVSLLLICFVLPAAAHNGTVGVAVPLEGIVIDGDFSDWPKGMDRYPISVVSYGEDPRGETDFQAFFRVGYSERENALYLAVEVRDDSVVIDPSETGSWGLSDKCMVLIDLDHREQEGKFGVYRAVGGLVTAEGGSLEDFTVTVRQIEGVFQYEWRVDIGEKSQGKVHLRAGRSIGLGVACGDLDEDDSMGWVAWGELRVYNSRSLSDLVLVDGPTGRLRGEVRWADEEVGIRRSWVGIRSEKSEKLWVVKIADSGGHFDVELPPGRYRVKRNFPNPQGESPQGEERAVEVEPGKVAKIELVVPLPQGKRTKAGKGRGHWRTIDVTDGLLSPVVYQTLQDENGDLWFATEAGVNRYDGRRFYALTKEDGLPHNWVHTILRDRKGDLWIGTMKGLCRYDGEKIVDLRGENYPLGGWIQALLDDSRGHVWIGSGNGLCRYDGKEFTSFSEEEELGGVSVRSILEDSRGSLWIGTEKGLYRYDGERFERRFTDENGIASNDVFSLLEDSLGNLWIGTKNGLYRYDGEQLSHFTTADGLAYMAVRSLLEDRHGHLWIGTGYYEWGALCRYDGKEFECFTTEDGLPFNTVSSIFEDREGNLWFGAGYFGVGGGLSRYSGEEFVSFSAGEGLSDKGVQVIFEDKEGFFWFGLWGGGLDRYDGEEFIHFGREDGLLGTPAFIFQDRQGNLWFGQNRYDGRHFETFTLEDGIGGWLHEAVEDREGNIWFICKERGAVYFDGESFTQFAGIGGLPQRWVRAFLIDSSGNHWFGTWGQGLFRWDGKEGKQFGSEDGFSGDMLHEIFEDVAGNTWIGSMSNGVARFDGEKFTHFMVEDGLAGSWVMQILQDGDGRMVFGTAGGGVSLFDGLVFQNLTTEDGLAGETIRGLYRDRRGDIWIGTDGGATRYRPNRTPPPIRIREVVADRSYGPVAEVALPSTQDYLALEFEGCSFKTRQMAYVYRLVGYAEEWQTTKEEKVAYADLPRGEYLFQVKAVDRDLTYSEQPAEVRVVIEPPYERLGLIGGLGVALIGLTFAVGYAVQKKRAQLRAERALMQELEEELQTAHDMQMGLMPAGSPEIEGIELGGRCLTANHVGGDFYQYFPQGEKLRFCLADITGHAMEAAIPAVMFSGILENQMEVEGSLEELFGRLNRSLTRILDNRTFVCLAMGELELASRKLRLTNGGCPYPYHFRAATGEVAELRVDAYPLGVVAETEYQVVEIELAPGDRLVFCSDGVIEGANPVEELFGFERTAEVIRQGCTEGLSVEALIDKLCTAVKEFRNGVPQEDDLTVMVLAVEG
jgi:ligand-binding sensor domain-containing protein/serine phosphatase RsbU (regulator of sigma subunit)